jgi:DNA replication protein DnaC
MDATDDELREVLEKRRELTYRRSGIPARFLGAESEEAHGLFLAISSGEAMGAYVCGAIGTGKTYLAMALAREWVDDGRTALVTSPADLLSSVRDTFGTKASEREAVSAYVDVGLLVIDDVDKVPAASSWGVETLFRVVDARYLAMSPTVVTTNLVPNQLVTTLGAACGNPSVAQALVSRLHDGTVRVKMSGSDRRSWANAGETEKKG